MKFKKNIFILSFIIQLIHSNHLLKIKEIKYDLNHNDDIRLMLQGELSKFIHEKTGASPNGITVTPYYAFLLSAEKNLLGISTTKKTNVEKAGNAFCKNLKEILTQKPQLFSPNEITFLDALIKKISGNIAKNPINKNNQRGRINQNTRQESEQSGLQNLLPIDNGDSPTSRTEIE